MRLQSLKLVAKLSRPMIASMDPVKQLIMAIGTRHHLRDLRSVELDGDLWRDDDGSSTVCCLLKTPGLDVLPLTDFTINTEDPRFFGAIARFFATYDPTWNLQVLGAFFLNRLLRDYRYTWLLKYVEDTLGSGKLVLGA